MESGRGPQYRKNLLPWEQQFCETLGISVEEYFQYHELVAQQLKEENARELIPDIRNEPVTIITLVVGVALSVAGALLAPKPRAPEQKEQGKPFQAEDIRGRTKFSPLSEFDSVQDLATLGSLVPLVYTKREGNHGGVRVESQLLWSRMRNLPIYQELRTLLLFSAGNVAAKPDYRGYAFGDSKLFSYMSAKVALWFNRGYEADSNQPFSVNDQFQYSEATKNVGASGFKQFFSSPPDGTPRRMIFCGTVTPTQSATFGQYSPIRNGHGWKYAFKWPGKGDGDILKKDLILGTRRKHVTGYHAGRTTLRIKEGTNGPSDLTFTIKDNDSDKIFQATLSDSSKPDRKQTDHFNADGSLNKLSVVKETDSLITDIGGLSEGLNAIIQSQQDADTALDVGELYLIGTNLYRCVSRNNDQGVQGTPFERGQGDVTYNLSREEEFRFDGVSVNDIYVNDPEDIFDATHQPIQKVAVASIGTTRAVDYVEIGFKSSVYRQVNGYPNVNQFTSVEIADDYAKDLQTWQPGSTTSYYDRVALFRMQIKRGNGDWLDISNEQVFAVHGKNAQDQYNQIQIDLPGKDFYEFRFIPVCGNAWISSGRYKNNNVYLLNSRTNLTTVKTIQGYVVRIKGREGRIVDFYDMESPLWQTGETGPNAPNNQNANSLLNDFWYYDADTASHESSPEHKITWINEYVYNSNSWDSNESKQYENLAYAGLICQSSTEISTFSNFSAYFKEGIQVNKFLNEDVKTYDATNNFPEIAYDLLTNRRYGVGEFVGKNSIDADRFNVAAEFCNANGFYWDGIISKATNVRSFLFEQAAYQLLDFTILGGRFSLYPAVPINSDYTISFAAKAGDSNFPIKALFTDGNVRNFKTTFLSPEERQLFTAELKYREEEVNGFPETHVTRVRLSDSEGGYYRDPVEAFDMTQFCTSREHAISFAKFALRLRQLVDHSVSFETTPDAAHALSPGDYIRLGVSVMHQDKRQGYSLRLRTGSIAPNGLLQINKSRIVATDGFDVYYWKPGFTQVRTGRLVERDGVVQDPALHGSLFTRKLTTAEARIYKIETIAYTEDSFVEITGSYVPLKSDGSMKVLDWSNNSFVIEDQRS